MRRSLLLPLLASATACATLPKTTTYTPPQGVAAAWVTFDAKGERSGGAIGLADRGTGRSMTIDDPARVASVSKIVTALTVMRLVEQGRLDLDEDVSAKLGYPVRNPAFPDRPITLRQLLSHTSSVQDAGENYVIRLGQQLRPQVERADSFDPGHPPGTFFRYSNLNFGFVGSVLEKATGERFDRLAERLVLRPLQLDACFNWTTCSEARIARAVVLYEEDGSPLLDDLQGRRPACPVFVAPGVSCDLAGYEIGSNGALFSPQGGLRISARDLAIIGQLLLSRGRHAGKAFLSPASIAAMVGPVWRFDGSNGVTDDGFYCAYGLGMQSLPGTGPGCRDDLFGDGRAVFGHAGDAYRVRSGLWIDPKRGRGIAFIAANNGKDPPRGLSAYRAIEEWLAAKLR